MRIVLLTMIFLMPAAATLAEDLEEVPPVTNQMAKKECGACHMAYQPALLPAQSWQAIFGDLANHFGDDASLADAARKEIADYYIAHAGKTGGSATSRITESGWWLDEHDDIKASRWNAPEVKFKGNCIACHKAADQGSYED
ncbi:MAG: diheme cytochrome c [Dongiaceae bacterium]